MLLRAIEKIRQKPKVVRQRYALVTTIVFTAFVTGVWSLSLPARFEAVQEGVTIASPEISSQTASVPFAGVWGQFKQQVLNLAGRDTATTTEQERTLISTSTPEVLPPPKNDPVMLESGSTIRFGAQPAELNASAIIVGTTSTTSSTSPAEQ